MVVIADEKDKPVIPAGVHMSDRFPLNCFRFLTREPRSGTQLADLMSTHLHTAVHFHCDWNQLKTGQHQVV